MIGEARRSEGMILNSKVISLWGKVGTKCERNACAAVLNMNTYRGSTTLSVYCIELGSVLDKDYLLLGSSKGMIQIMSLDGLITAHLNLGEDTDITSLSLQTSTGLLLSTTRNGKVQFWSLTSRKLYSNIVVYLLLLLFIL